MTKVLIIEDDPILLKIYKEKFELSGFEVIAAYDGEQGINEAKKHPDFILLDLMMPGVDGGQVLKELKQNPDTKDIPVAILTVIPLDSENHISKELLTQVVNYWVKDKMKPSDVVSGVKKYLGEH